MAEPTGETSSGRSLPHPAPCLSYWQRTTRAFPLLHANRNVAVPASAKYVIVGSGLSGALTAFELLDAGVKGDDVIILEAREAASGASSRNAGHVRPDAFRGFTFYSKLHGPAQALQIIANERLVLQRVDAFVKKHNVPCDFNLTSTFDVCMTSDFAAYEAASFNAYKTAGGDTSHINIYEGKEAESKSGIRGAIAAYQWPAASIHPAKLAHFLLQTAVSQGVRLFTFCPATQVTQNNKSSSQAQLWDVHTPRGTITASKIIHCTNAHAALLLPTLDPYITPNRAQAHSLIPTPSLAGAHALQSTYSLRYSLEHFYSLIQRRGDGTLILGVSRINPNLSKEAVAGRLSTDDSGFSGEQAADAVGSLQRVFPQLGLEGKRHGEGLDHVWTGIVAMTGDSVPFVGEIGGLPGQFVCAGFGAHGMARIFTCAPGVVKLILGKEWRETGLPECFQITKERMAKLAAGKGKAAQQSGSRSKRESNL
ncbi:hypothetical protein FQN53_002916 [Emmonsiellopsis sp. PD_33]|nr:hypothetical protein FQN53_002916 [Emmonsiellopsis sp. PD_33]